jgi:predicted permease
MGDFHRTLALGVRIHRRTPIVTAIIVATLSLGIAATSVAFSLINAFFLRPPPFEDPDRFVRVYHQAGNSTQYLPLSYPEFEDIRALTHIFDDALVEEPVPLVLNFNDVNDRVFGEVVSSGYFSVLGVRPVLGRPFSTQEERAGEALVIISHGLWTRRFGSDPGIIGRDLRIDGRPFRVIGVAPPGFGGTILAFSSDLWMPIESSPDWRQRQGNRSDRGLFTMARRAPGVELGQAQAAVALLADRLQREFPETNSGVRLATLDESTGRVFPTFRNEVLGASAVVVLVPLLVTLVACANVAGVLLVKAEVRRPEFGVRLALGASRGRILSQLLTESATLSVAAGALGLALTWQVTRFVSATQVTLARGAAVGLDVSLDWRVIAGSVLLTALTAFLFGLAPALEASRQDLLAVLKNSAPPGARRSWSRRTFLSAQVAVSMVLLACGGLFLRSLQQTRNADLGFDPAGVVTTAVDLRGGSGPNADRHLFWQKLVAEVRRLPQTESVSLTYRPPLELGMVVMSIGPDGFQPSPGQAWPTTEYSAIEPDYFRTLRIEFVEGRDFTQRDLDTDAPIVILNDVLARQFWPREPVVGKYVMTPDGTRSEIIGVVRRSKYLLVSEEPKPYVYVPERGGPDTMTLVARGSGDPAAYLETIREIVRGLEPGAAMFDVGTLAARVDKAVAPTTGAASSLSIVGLMVLGLTALGLFGAVAQAVARRTHEIGVRRALGAQNGNLIWLVGRETLVLVASGIVLGSVAALALAPALRLLLYDVDPSDPAVFGLAPAVLLVVCLAAAWIPIRRALRISPSDALRYE